MAVRLRRLNPEPDTPSTADAICGISVTFPVPPKVCDSETNNACTISSLKVPQFLTDI